MHDRFVSLLTTHNTMLYAYAYAIIPNHADADEVLQKASIIIWEKFETFEEGTSFPSWARAILYRTAMNHVRSLKHRPVLCDPETLEKLSIGFERAAEGYKDHRMLSALDQCIERLSSQQHRILSLRYIHQKSSLELAQAVGKSAAAIDVLLFRIRRRLEKCIRARLLKESTA